MRIDCDECAMQHTVTCNDCVVAFLLRDAEGPVEIDDAYFGGVYYIGPIFTAFRGTSMAVNYYQTLPKM